MDGDTLLVTLPKELGLMSSESRSASADAKRLAYLAGRLPSAGEMHSSSSSSSSAISLRQQHAAARHEVLLKTKSNPRFFARQHEARARVESERQQSEERARVQKQALETRLRAAEQRHEETWQTRLISRAASATRLHTQRHGSNPMTMESWMPQDSDRWMGALRKPQTLKDLRDARLVEAGQESAQAASKHQALQGLTMRSRAAWERYCHFHGERSRHAEEQRRQRQEGQQANLYRLLSTQHTHTEQLRRRFEDEDSRDATRKQRKRELIDQLRSQSRQQSLQRQELVVSANMPTLTMESWSPQESDKWMSGLRSSSYHVESHGGTRAQWKSTSVQEDD